MAINYVNLAATAKRLVEENGRSVTFVKLNSTPPDGAKPWRGPANPTAAPDASLSLVGVNVEPTGLVRLGIASEEDDFIKRAEKIFMFAPGAVSPQDLKSYDQILDGSERYAFNGVKELRPGSVTLLFYVSVRR